MKWRVYLSSVLVVFLSLSFGSFIINQKNNVNAVSDYTYSWDFTNHPEYTLCGGSSDRNCSDWSYIIFEPSGSCIGNAPGFYVYGIAAPYNSIITLCFKTISPITESQIRITGGVFVPNNYSGGDVSVTLTDSLVSCPGAPSGSLSIIENGTYDVTNYAQAVVDVPPEVVQGDYHDDLVSINNSILIVCAVVLVIYFFYAIYKMLLGGKTL